MDTTTTTKEAVEYELFPFVRVYTSGRVERILETDVLPPGLDPDTGVLSKDVTLRPDTGLSVRLYLPPDTDTDTTKKLPVLVYYHGGGFVIETASSPTYHNYLNSLAARAGVLAVSVDYRRAPEHPLPAAYEDSWAALEWAVSEPPAADPWLADRGDLRRVFLAGDSAGANIAHHMAMRAGAADGRNKKSLQLEGIALVHPYFWGKEPVGSETRDAPARAFAGALWRLVCPSSSSSSSSSSSGADDDDDPRINPVALEGLGCRRVLVSVAAEDTLRERGVDYYERLRRSGWGGAAELAETEGVGHVFHLQDAKSDKALAEMERMVAFLNGKN